MKYIKHYTNINMYRIKYCKKWKLKSKAYISFTFLYSKESE